MHLLPGRLLSHFLLVGLPLLPAVVVVVVVVGARHPIVAAISVLVALLLPGHLVGDLLLPAEGACRQHQQEQSIEHPHPTVHLAMSTDAGLTLLPCPQNHRDYHHNSNFLEVSPSMFRHRLKRLPRALLAFLPCSLILLYPLSRKRGRRKLCSPTLMLLKYPAYNCTF